MTNLENGRSIIVKINDRGPFSNNRIIDLSYAAATKLNILDTGTALVEIKAIDPRKKTPKKPPTTSANKEASLYLQVAAFSNSQNAETLRTRLQDMTTSSIHVSRATKEQQDIYRVRIGPIQNISEADRMSKLLASKGLGEPRVIID